MTIPRESYLNKIQAYVSKPIIKVLTGMRRVGKSTILQQLREKLVQSGVPQRNIFLLNKELLQWDHVRTYVDLEQEVKRALSGTQGNRWILIDEIQEILEWERAVRSFMAEGLGDVVITGSNAGLLASELAILLTGRYIEIPIHPLGFSEFLAFRRACGEDSDSSSLFRLYLRYGGLPGIHMFEQSDDQVFHYLEAILNTILLKDVVRRHHIRDVGNVERILYYLFDNSGSFTSARNIYSFFRNQKISISPDTIVAYLDYLKQAYIVHRVDRYELRGKKHLEYIHKYYVGDLGLRHTVFGYRDNDIGTLLESAVFLELLRRGYSVRTGIVSGGEIDFVAELKSSRIYIQVAYLLSDPSTVEREFGRLEQIPDNYPKYVLSMDDYFPPERKGIRHLHIRDFLLGKWED
ncbi:MAG: ATP-binding protein [Spirochaetes bacterium]|nr:ATP-binding protein [Spirochaetota bacterium]